jgi:hypothetical protein
MSFNSAAVSVSPVDFVGTVVVRWAISASYQESVIGKVYGNTSPPGGAAVPILSKAGSPNLTPKNIAYTIPTRFVAVVPVAFTHEV